MTKPRKIKDVSTTILEVSPKNIASGLGARVINIPEISKEEAEKYQSIGSPVGIPSAHADKLSIYNFGSRMLNDYYGQEKSLDDVVGYRVLDSDEEVEFREEIGNKDYVIVRYYVNR